MEAEHTYPVAADDLLKRLGPALARSLQPEDVAGRK
jgi:hypothetical protein